MTDLLPADLISILLDGSRLALFMAGVAFTVAMVHRAHTSATQTYKTTAEFEANAHKDTKAELSAVRVDLAERDDQLAQCRLELGRALVDRAALVARLEIAGRLMTQAGLSVELIDGPLPSMTDQARIHGGSNDVD